MLHRDQNVLCSWQGSAQTAPEVRVHVSLQSDSALRPMNVPRVIKVTEITPALQAAAEMRTGESVLSVQERVWGMSQQAFVFLRDGQQCLGAAGLQPPEGLLSCVGTTHTAS